MDAGFHIVSGFLTGYVPLSFVSKTAGVIAGSLNAIAGGLPDIPFNSGWYEKAHAGQISKVMRWIPGWGLHLWIDKHTHGEGKRWWVWNERMWVEPVGWAMVVLIIWKGVL